MKQLQKKGKIGPLTKEIEADAAKTKATADAEAEAGKRLRTEVEKLREDDDCGCGISDCRNTRKQCRTCQISALRAERKQLAEHLDMLGADRNSKVIWRLIQRILREEG